MTFNSPEVTQFATPRLRYAIAASLLLHLLILWPAASQVLTKDTPLSLHARLKSSARPPGLVPSLPRAAASAPTSVSSKASSNSPVLVPARPSSVPPAPLVSANSSDDPTPAPPPIVASTVSAALAGAEAGNGGVLTEATALGEVAAGLRGYRLALALQARRLRRDPVQAMSLASAGSVDVRLEVGSDGRPRGATLARSSGYDPLDRAALSIVDTGARHAPVPESLRGKYFAVMLRLDFSSGDR